MAPNISNGLYMPQTYSFLSPETFETLVEGYINQLHIRKRNKALITQQLANDCLMVLTNPENTAIFNPKFRWWVRKHFVFTVVGELRILLDKKNGKPVCVREQLYDKVCYFHHIIGHGGRDKTFAAITKSYSKVPAELVSLFTKNCQTCLGVRKYSKNKRPILNENEYPQHHPHSHSHSQQQQPSSSAASSQPQQQQQQQQPHLTCDTSAFSSATSQYSSQQQQYQNMLTKSEHGTLTPISPLMSSSGSGFFSSNHSSQQQLDSSSYSQLQHQQQLQQMHNAINAHQMSMTLGLSEMSLGNSHVNSLTGLSSLPFQNSMSTLSSACSTPTTMTKMELPVMHSYDPNSMAGALLPLSHLTQQAQYQHALNGAGLGSPSDLSSHYDHDLSSAAQYSPLLEQQYHTQAQYQQHPFHNDYTSSYSTNDQQLHSTFSAAMSLTSMPLLQQQQQQQQSAYEQQQQQQQQQHLQEYHHHQESPLLSQNQMFQKQIQQEQQRFHQQHQQLSVSTSFSTLSGSGSSASLSSPPPSAVPSLGCPLSTPTTETPVLASAATIHSNSPFATSHLHPTHALTSLLDHEQKGHHHHQHHHHLTAVAGLVSHDL